MPGWRWAWPRSPSSCSNTSGSPAAVFRPGADVEAKVRGYLDRTAWAVPGVITFRVFYGFTTGIGRPRPVMAFNLLGLTLKVPLNWMFMYSHFGFPALGRPAAAGRRR